MIITLFVLLLIDNKMGGRGNQVEPHFPNTFQNPGIRETQKPEQKPSKVD